jgi:hypothetical protein
VAISSSWRGSVGIIKPTMRLGGIEEFIRLLPEGIGVLPLFVNIRKGTADEFKGVLDHFEEHVKTLAGVPVELIHPEGAPPFMVHGLAGEREIVQRWERAYGVPIVTAPQTQVEAMRALGIRRIVGVSYFRGDINETFAQYFRDAGIEVLVARSLRTYAQDVHREPRRGRHLHARFGLESHGHRAVDGKRLRRSRRARADGALVGDSEPFARARAAPRVRPVAGRASRTGRSRPCNLTR